MSNRAARFAAAPWVERGGLAASLPLSDTSLIKQLSPREGCVLKLVVEGYTSKEIARELGVLPTTVDTYRSRIMRKLDVGEVPSLVRLAIRAGLIQP